MPTASPRDVVADLKDIELEDDELVEGVVLIIKVSGDGHSKVGAAGTPGMSHWEMLGMVRDVETGMLNSGVRH